MSYYLGRISMRQNVWQRIRHVLFTTAVVLSLLAAVATAVQWVRGSYISDNFSYQRFTIVGRNLFEKRAILFLRDGSFWLEFQWHNEHVPSNFAPWPPIKRLSTHFSRGWGDHPLKWPPQPGSILGIFVSMNRDSAHAFGEFNLLLPYAALFLATSILPAAWLTAAIRRFRRKKYLDHAECDICGYDLRATPGRCPECGRIPDKPGITRPGCM
jgi:hypothetical protein